MKKILIILVSALLFTGCTSAPAQKTDEELKAEGWVKDPENNGYVLESEIPAGSIDFTLPVARDTTKTYKPGKDEPEVPCTEKSYSSGCSSVNVDNFIEFANVDDAYYIDVRDYNDYAQKHLKNFEVIPYFGLIFSKEAGGNHLFYGDSKAPTANYEESEIILNALFPKDKTLFIMCQSGARVVWLMEILEAHGYDMSKIYNIGGMGQYTKSEYRALTTNTSEIIIDAKYNFEGLTKK